MHGLIAVAFISWHMQQPEKRDWCGPDAWNRPMAIFTLVEASFQWPFWWMRSLWYICQDFCCRL